MTITANRWYSDLVANSAPEVDYSYVGPHEGSWVPCSLPGTEARDLDATSATRGRMGARELRPNAPEGAADTGWCEYQGDFRAWFLRSGTLRVETEDGQAFELAAGDMVSLPPSFGFRGILSPDTLVYELTAPAQLQTVTLPVQPEHGVGDATVIVDHDRPDAYQPDGGPLSRAFFRYRDLGVADATDGRVMLEVIRAHEAAEATGWHHHSMAQIALILTGRAVIQVEDNPPVELLPGAALVQGARVVHDVYHVSADYSLLEVYMPADWDTIPCAEPVGAAPRLER